MAPAVPRTEADARRGRPLARRQVAAGAIGMTCAMLREAELLVEHGFDNVLVLNHLR